MVPTPAIRSDPIFESVRIPSIVIRDLNARICGYKGLKIVSVFLCTVISHVYVPNFTLIDLYRDTGSLGIARFNSLNNTKNGHFCVLPVYGLPQVRNLDMKNVNVR